MGVTTRAGLLADCRALVVDVSDVVGVAVVRRLAAEGARVAFSSVDADRSARLVRRVRGFGRELEALSSTLAPPDLLATAARVLGGLDLVVVLGDPGALDGRGAGDDLARLAVLVRSAASLAVATEVTVVAARLDEGARRAGAGPGVRLLSLADMGLDGIPVAEGRAAAVAMVAAGWAPPSWGTRERWPA
ncbi:hypothetical protein [Nocardioides nanhaiensis]